MLYFLNQLDLSGYLESDDYKKFDCIKKILTDKNQKIIQRN